MSSNANRCRGGVVLYSNTCSENQRGDATTYGDWEILKLAQSADTAVLCEAWGISRRAVLARKKGEQPMTIREVGALAFIYGLTLPGILSI